MIEDFIVFATNEFFERGLIDAPKMIEDFIFFATNGFL